MGDNFCDFRVEKTDITNEVSCREVAAGLPLRSAAAVSGDTKIIKLFLNVTRVVSRASGRGITTKNRAQPTGNGPS
jgi:hypothetical protein